MDVIVNNWARLWQGVIMTLKLDLAILVLGTLLALVVAFGRLSSNWLVSRFFATYSALLRGIPVLVVLFLSYYALPQIGIRLNAYMAAVLALSIATSAYMGEIFRAGIMAVNPGQFQAARSLGMGWAHTMRRIILPQAFRIILPPYVSQAIIVAKGTSVAGVIAVTELTGTAYGLMSKTYRPFEILGFTVTMYLIITSILVALQAYLEKRWKLRL